MTKEKDSNHIKGRPPGWPMRKHVIRQAAADISKPQEGLRKNSIVHANASLFRGGAKIGYLQMVHIITGFAHSASIMACSKKAKTHRDTVRDIYAVLRDRLLEPRFDKWVQSAYASPERGEAEDATVMNEAKAALFGCHENTECLKRYRAGRRKTRVCRACLIKEYVRINDGTDQQTSDLIEMIDKLRDFYRQLGWKESVIAASDPQAVFAKRFRHYEVFSTAVGNSAFDDNGKVISAEDDFLSVPHLTKIIFDDLKNDPIR